MQPQFLKKFEPMLLQRRFIKGRIKKQRRSDYPTNHRSAVTRAVKSFIKFFLQPSS